MKKLFIITGLCLSLVGCSNAKTPHLAKAFPTGQIYATYTIQEKNNQFKTQVWGFDFTTKKNQLITTVPYKNQYPLTYYDKDTNNVYYTKRIDGVDQIFAYNVKNKTDKQLTKSIYSVNDMVKISNHELLLVTNLLKSPSPVNSNMLAVLDLKTNKVKPYYIKNYGVSSTVTKYDHNHYIFAYFDAVKDRKWADTHSSEDADFYTYKVPSTIALFNIKTKKIETLFKDNNGEIESIVRQGNDIYYLRSQDGVAEPKLCHYNVNSKKIEIINTGKTYFNQLLALDQNQLLATGDTEVCVYDLKEKTLKIYMSQDNNGAYNNMHYIS